MNKAVFTRNLLSMYPYWTYTVMRNFRSYSKVLTQHVGIDNYYILQVIRWYEGLNMTELAGHLRITKQQATHKVDKLYESGYIERRYSESDRRSIRLFITPKAAAELDSYHETMQDFVTLFEQYLTAEEMETFNKGMEYMLSVFPKLDYMGYDNKL